MKTAPSADDIRDVLAASEKKAAHSFASAFSRKSANREDGWHLLHEVFNLHQRLNDPGQPFEPMVITKDGRRSFLPEDLTEDQLDWLRELEELIFDPEFRARIADILWLCTKDRDAAARAVNHYMNAGLAVEDLDHWTESIARYSRAYRLATQLGRKGELRADVLSFLLTRLRNVKGEDPRWWSLKIMRLLYEARHGETSELIDYARVAANRAKQEREFQRERDYLQFIVKLHQRDQNSDAAEAVRVEIAMNFRREAEAADESGGGMKSHHHWEAAVKAFRERPSLKDQVPELQARLAAAGRETLKLMREHSHSTDVSEIVEQIRRNFSGEPTDAAFYKFVGFPLSNPEELQREAEQAKDSFLSSMFQSRFFDYEGRTVAVAPGALSPDDIGYDERIRCDVQRLLGIRRHFSVQVQIANALRILSVEHAIDAEFLRNKIEDSAFIPEGRLEHYSEGLAFGFKWQFAHAVLFLVPQFEAGLRNIAVQLDLSPRNLHPSGVEDAWGLDRLLSESAIVSQLGNALTFELRSLLIEDFGPKFRHNLSHGLIPPNALCGTDALYAWWLFLRLCVVPTSGFHAFC